MVSFWYLPSTILPAHNPGGTCRRGKARRLHGRHRSAATHQKGEPGWAHNPAGISYQPSKGDFLGNFFPLLLSLEGFVLLVIDGALLFGKHVLIDIVDLFINNDEKIESLIKCFTNINILPRRLQ